MKTRTERITEEITLLRVDDDRIEYFEALWKIPEGVTYNAYLLQSEGQTVLFDGWKAEYSEEFFERLCEIVKPEDIDYIVIHHMEPDHSGTLRRVLELNGYRAAVLGHPLVERLMKAFYGLDGVKFIPVQDEEGIEIGGKKFKFVHVPWFHWPDTIFSYIEGEKILLTCDAFGGYSISDSSNDEDEEAVLAYLPYARKYAVSVVGTYRKHIIRNIQKIIGLGMNPKMILPAHGLYWGKDPETILNAYRNVAMGVPTKGKVVVAYGSMYGFVERAVEAVVCELERRGYRPKVIKFTDKHSADVADLAIEASDSEAIVLGMATYDKKVFPLMRFATELLIEKADYDKPVLLVSSYGWGSSVAKNVKEMFANTELRLVDTLEFRGSSSSDGERIRKGVDSLIEGIKPPFSE